jgi:hypothetical protein
MTAPKLSDYTAAATHIELARIASGLTNEQFAAWLRCVARDLEKTGGSS